MFNSLKNIKIIIPEILIYSGNILTKNKPKLIQIVERLMVKETLDGDELEALFEEPITSAEPVVEAEAPLVAESSKDKPKARSKSRKTAPIPRLIPKQTPATSD